MKYAAIERFSDSVSPQKSHLARAGSFFVLVVSFDFLDRPLFFRQTERSTSHELNTKLVTIEIDFEQSSAIQRFRG